MILGPFLLGSYIVCSSPNHSLADRPTSPVHPLSYRSNHLGSGQMLPGLFSEVTVTPRTKKGPRGVFQEGRRILPQDWVTSSNNKLLSLKELLLMSFHILVSAKTPVTRNWMQVMVFGGVIFRHWHIISPWFWGSCQPTVKCSSAGLVPWPHAPCPAPIGERGRWAWNSLCGRICVSLVSSVSQWWGS